MDGRMRIAVLSVLCVLLAAVLLVAEQRRDTTAPEIVFEKTPIYYDGRDTSTLLEGVSALDERDGDVTESVLISAVYPVSAESGIVIYAAKDLSNNVTTAGRGFYYTDTAALRAPGLPEEDVLSASGDGAQGNPDISGDGVQETSGEDAARGDAAAELPPEGAQTEGPQINGTMQADEWYDALREANLAQGMPFVRLVQYEAAVERGSTFNIYRYIREAVDDADTIQTMLRVDGTVDTGTPGTYEVRIYARDSAGNESNVEILTVTVE